ncbi:tryptophan synthase subunit alpha [Rhodoblastus sphagnicola]|uniref:Tryptophan synthase alpha chain n=1 Tax=Rhodoblastus sphagnicola TaxID=333368 RepID=A0A2S6NAG7_9HYPH|nr:tryptophan synthase subunit alpha [Rhodoblastus sphagnicola]MBB4199551.1 tryptophan synthase alpha chain [Rhodoblastus sphagnicola]PPQ31605.1 tryptophan synthase subunit alpha [Rhodoblastus sphagnicola]
MNRLDARLAQLRAQNRAGLVCYFMAGDPDFDASRTLLAGLGAAGADVIELGLPFSDPVADGPTIQKAHLRARAAGQTTARTLALVAALRETDATTPVVLMGYLNPALQYGVQNFFAEAAASGADAALLLDLPVEHAAPFRAAARSSGLHLIAMTAPTSDDARLAEILRGVSGFVYHATINGTTGAARCSPAEVSTAIARVRRHTTLPVAAGFGIREPAQARDLAEQADLVVIGSQLVETLAQGGASAALESVYGFARALRGAAQSVRAPCARGSRP